jgi:hypothetical protein
VTFFILQKYGFLSFLITFCGNFFFKKLPKNVTWHLGFGQPKLNYLSLSRRDQRFAGDTSTYLVTDQTITFFVVVDATVMYVFFWS